MTMNEQEKEDVFDYLDELRESGVTNMFGATPFIVEEFSVSTGDARTLLQEWMTTFSARKAAKQSQG